ncbi:allantoicase [Heterostelium album PN500]|uniref:Allantoicase n=1 Tax=Heterostelium pallidum (strain ATCC 26659 / Pp 5 / PN500) TaxID=670386 RepID=D3BMQ0_HETP5|nr:allantoicase [Heterostelium album PN500]EFA77262.1 allantoicase [Heterostelium album PN500]|eukprot:XP_020429391.1 allantoicase [Heterostelium album PN500]
MVHTQVNLDSLPDFVKNYAELLSDKVGGQVLSCSDQWFAPCVNLISNVAPIWAEGKYVDTGKWMDGWETRRHNPTYDWCILRLGMSGVIKGFEIDTAFFTGNYPPFASIEAICDDSEPTAKKLEASNEWFEVLAKSNLGPGCKQYFAIDSSKRWTHLRFKIYPDGGVARLRVYGQVSKDWSLVIPGELVDLAAIENGGIVVGCSDMYFGNKNNIIMPGRSVNMGDGWETKRRRGEGYDWLVVKLGASGSVKRVEVDTNWFKGNFPTSCSIDGIYSDSENDVPTGQWSEILPNTALTGHHRHLFQRELKDTDKTLTHIRLNIYPDGGVSRLRIHCAPSQSAQVENIRKINM